MVNINTMQRKLFFLQCIFGIVYGIEKVIRVVMNPLKVIKEMDNPTFVAKAEYYFLEFLMYIFILPLVMIHDKVRDYGKITNERMIEEMLASLNEMPKEKTND